MNNAPRTFLLMLLTTAFLASCAGQSEVSPTPDVNALMTESVGTFAAQFFQTQTALVTPATPTPLNTPTSIPTTTPLAMPLPPLATPTYIFYASPTGTQYTPTTNPSSLAYGCNNLGFVRDVTDSSGTNFKPGDKFTKTWQVANTGTCNWLFGYRLIPVSGTSLAEDPVKVSGNYPVPPGEWRQVSVNITAPKDPGTYTQYWQLSDGAGNRFGSLLGVTIVVKKPADTPTPTTAVSSTATSTPTPTLSYP